MNLRDGLRQIADYLGLDSDELITYAAEDQVGGWDYWDENTNGAPVPPYWPIGSIFSAEGKVLYALARALNATNVLEMGTHYGCSATHLLEALDEAGGHLVAIDDLSHAQPAPEVGILIPDNLRGRFSLQRISLIDLNTNVGIAYRRDGEDFVPYDLIFEDLLHDIGSVRLAWEFARDFLRPGGVMVSHDAAHFLVGEDVQEGIRQAGITDHLTVKIDETDCGLAIWRKPGLFIPARQSEPEAAEAERQESDEKYAGWIKADLQAQLDARHIPYKSKMRNEELIELLVRDDEAAD